MKKMAAAMVCVSVTEENLIDDESLPKDSCCKKCSDLETRLQEALKELSSAHLIIELLRNEVNIGTESTGKQCDCDIVKKKNTYCDPTEKLHIKTKWSDVVTGRNTDRKKRRVYIKADFGSGHNLTLNRRRVENCEQRTQKASYCKSCSYLSNSGNNKLI